MTLINSVIEEATDQEVLRKAVVKDDAWDNVPKSKGKLVPKGSSISTFLTKRDC